LERREILNREPNAIEQRDHGPRPRWGKTPGRRGRGVRSAVSRVISPDSPSTPRQGARRPRPFASAKRVLKSLANRSGGERRHSTRSEAGRLPQPKSVFLRPTVGFGN
jgi:hypothetical protein